MDGDKNAQADKGKWEDDHVHQINILLDTIRLNLSNIERTWGKDSRQYRSASEVMQSCLVENVTRLRGSAKPNDVQIKDDAGDGDGDIEVAIEKLMGELRISSSKGFATTIRIAGRNRRRLRKWRLSYHYIGPSMHNSCYESYPSHVADNRDEDGRKGYKHAKQISTKTLRLDENYLPTHLQLPSTTSFVLLIKNVPYKPLELGVKDPRRVHQLTICALIPSDKTTRSEPYDLDATLRLFHEI
ncbi:hypothetical protein LTR44_001983 [Exophiala sp. CCFEE 6388]|nr:hypothetical protein LTR44_001983 [Eurotiomycetes sp. CCFEE 6388]